MIISLMPILKVDAQKGAILRKYNSAATNDPNTAGHNDASQIFFVLWIRNVAIRVAALPTKTSINPKEKRLEMAHPRVIAGI
jgi:hypothetical protein